MSVVEERLFAIIEDDAVHFPDHYRTSRVTVVGFDDLKVGVAQCRKASELTRLSCSGGTGDEGSNQCGIRDFAHSLLPEDAAWIHAAIVV